MPYPPILRDSQGSPIPQIWDGQNWQAYKGNAPLVTVHQNNAQANGNGVAADVDGYGSAMFQVVGTFSATINFEGSVDGVNYAPLVMIDPNGNRVVSATAAGLYKADIAGLKYIRARISNYVSGSITVISRVLPMVRPAELPVLLNGRNVQPTANLLTNTPLAAGAHFAQPWRDLTAVPGVFLTALEVYADTLVTVQYEIDDGSHFAWLDLHVILAPGGCRYVRPYRPIGKRGRWVIKNPTNSAQTVLQVTEYVYTQAAPVVQNQQSVLVYKLAVRDTTTHTYITDPASIFRFFRSGHGGGKVPIYVANWLNQAATITVLLGPVDTISGITFLNVLGQKTVPANSRTVITNTDFPGLDVPSEVVTVYVACATAPTSGDISVMIDNSTGGGV